MNIWKCVYIGLEVLGLGLVAVKHGQPRTGDYNFWFSLLGVVLQFSILAAAGFFS